MSLLSLLPQTALVEYHGESDDGYGGQVRAWTTRHASYPCRIYQHSGQVVRLASGEDAQSTHKMLGQDGVILAGDRMTVGGVIYDVLEATRVYGKSHTHHVEAQLKVAG